VFVVAGRRRRVMVELDASQMRCLTWARVWDLEPKRMSCILSAKCSAWSALKGWSDPRLKASRASVYTIAVITGFGAFVSNALSLF
jgi:hypothetical protein